MKQKIIRASHDGASVSFPIPERYRVDDKDCLEVLTRIVEQRKTPGMGKTERIQRECWRMVLALGRERSLNPFFIRETEEQTQPDGSVKKVAVFRHDGFIGTEYTDA